MAKKCGCGCGGDISKMSKQAKYLPGHRQRAYQRKRDERVREALAAVGDGAAVKMTATQAAVKPRGASGKRSATRYALIPADSLPDPVATVEAHDRRAAARMTDVDVVPIPERSLRPLAP